MQIHPLRHARHRLAALLMLAGACAASPAVPLDAGELEQGDDDARASDASVLEPPASDDDELADDDDEPRDAEATPTAPAKDAKDAATAPSRSTRDGQVVSDATAAGDATARVADAQTGGSVADASPVPVIDASSGPESAPQDGEIAPRDAGSPARDAAMSSAPGRCQRSSECQELCLFVGVFPCCRADHTCGCTWAPGAYCL